MKKLLIFFAALLCGVSASQLPEYAQQYQQRLSGAVGELSQMVERFDADARNNALTREQALARYRGSQDGFLSDRGQSIMALLKRHDRLSLHLQNLQAANPVNKLIIFARDRDLELARDTVKIYQPALPLTAMGAAHAGGGFVAGWLIFSTLLWPFGRSRRRDKKRHTVRSA